MGNTVKGATNKNCYDPDNPYSGVYFGIGASKATGP